MTNDFLSAFHPSSFFLVVLAFHPDLPIFKHFFLPNGNGAFQFANQPLACFERCFTMWRTDRDHHACFTNLQSPSPVNDADVSDLKLTMRVGPESLHFSKRPWFI